MYSFQQEELEVLKGDYVNCLHKIFNYRTQLKKLSSFETYVYHHEMGIVNKVIFDLWDSILAMEKYLPQQKQYYLRRKPPKRQLKFTNDQRIAEHPESYVCNTTLQNDLLKMLKKILTERQFLILHMYYYQNMNQREIASTLHISKPTVCEHINKALSNIRSSATFWNLLNELL